MAQAVLGSLIAVNSVAEKRRCRDCKSMKGSNDHALRVSEQHSSRPFVVVSLSGRQHGPHRRREGALRAHFD